MKNVADLAGVSKSTVSQYLNGNYEYMSEKTRIRIQKAVLELNYHPNQIARSLKQKKTNLIGVVSATLTSQFTTEFISVIEKEVNSEKLDVIVANTEDDAAKERQYIESLVARQVDGLIVFPTIENLSFYQDLKKRNFPLVFVDRKLSEINSDTILLDNQLATRLAVDELVDNGHERIGLLTFPLGKTNSITTRIERKKGYELALKEHGIISNENYFKAAYREEIPDLLDKMMALPEPPTAIIASNDIILGVLLSWIQDRKIMVPEELSIIGIDNVSFASFYAPPITTIKQPINEMGQHAARLLVRKIHEPQYSEPIKMFEPTIIRRCSIKNYSY